MEKGQEGDHVSTGALPVDIVRLALFACSKSVEQAQRFHLVLVPFGKHPQAVRLRRMADRVAYAGFPLASKTGAAKKLSEEGFGSYEDLVQPYDAEAIAEAMQAANAACAKTAGQELDDGILDWLAEWDGHSGFKLSDAYIAPHIVRWIHAWCSPTGQVVPAGTFLLWGARSGDGKTTCAGLFMISAILADLPIFCVQVELGYKRHVRDFATQMAKQDRGGKPTEQAIAAIRKVRPDIDRYLSYPKTKDKKSLERIEVIRAEIQAWYDSLPERKDGNVCKGLVIVDYLQCIKDPNSRAEHEAMDHIVQDLAVLAHETNLVVVALSQMTRGSQLAFAADVIKARDKKPADRADAIQGAIEDYASNGMAGGDIKRKADVAICIGGIKGQRILVASKDRGSAWGDDRDAHRTQLFRLTRSGAMALPTEGRPQTLEEYVATIPKTPKGGQQQEPAPVPVPATRDPGWDDLNAKLRADGGTESGPAAAVDLPQTVVRHGRTLRLPSPPSPEPEPPF
jgi:hypothetical protein